MCANYGMVQSGLSVPRLRRHIAAVRKQKFDNECTAVLAGVEQCGVELTSIRGLFTTSVGVEERFDLIDPPQPRRLDQAQMRTPACKKFGGPDAAIAEACAHD